MVDRPYKGKNQTEKMCWKKSKIKKGGKKDKDEAVKLKRTMKLRKKEKCFTRARTPNLKIHGGLTHGINN